MKNILITGGSGFIGTNLINFLLQKYPNYNLINIDCLNYASTNSTNKSNNYVFFKENINNYEILNNIFKKYKINYVINLAAETHVDNSIKNPIFFAQNNILGTINLLNVARENWKDKKNNNIFFQISTDEIFGNINKGSFNESSPYNPQSPYSASKAASDHFVRAFANTYNIKYIITNCSNNYGPFQHKEKLIPKTISNILNNKKIPIYSNGSNIRNWIYVLDHVRAIDNILHNSKPNQTYNIASEYEISNIKLVKLICNIMQKKLNLKNLYNLIYFTKDRPGHDFRYSINYNKIINLGWKSQIKLEEGLIKTINWYINENE